MRKCAQKLQLYYAVSRGVNQSGLAENALSLVVNRGTAEMIMSEKMISGIIGVVQIAEGFKAAMEFIVSVAAVERSGVCDEYIKPFLLFDPAFELFCPLPHLRVGVLVGTELAALAAAEPGNAKPLIFDYLSVYIGAALRRAVKIRSVMVAVNIEKRSGNHCDEITEIGCLQITAGYYDIGPAKNSRIEMIPDEFAFNIGNSKNLN